MTVVSISAAELAARAGLTLGQLEQNIAGADRRPLGPNRATRRAMAKHARKAAR